MAREYRFNVVLAASIAAAFCAFASAVRDVAGSIGTQLREVFAVAFPAPAAPRVETPLPGVAWVLGLFQTRSFVSRYRAREPDRQTTASIRAYA